MPELPEVEGFRKYFEGTSLNQEITKIEIDDPKLVKIPAEEFRESIIGNSFASTDRIGKYFFAHLSNGNTTVFHFGLTGKFYYFSNEDPPRFTRVLFHFADGFKLAFINMRKFGWVDLITDIAEYQKKKGLGTDAQQITFDEFREKFQKRKSFIKPKLMDQKIMAGVGNWIADEILYQSRLHPESLIQNLDEQDFRNIYEKMQHILNVAVKEESNYESFPEYFFIHNRKDDGICHHTGEPVERIEVGGRGTYFSPKHQVRK